MAENNLTPSEVAAGVFVDFSTIYRVRGEKRSASPALIKALVAYSLQLVKDGRASRSLDANDFFKLPTRIEAGQ